MLAWAERWLGPVAGRCFLELVCGAGATALRWASRGAGFVAVDTSAVPVARPQRICAEHCSADLDAVQPDALDVAVSGAFDFMYGSLVLHHLEPFGLFAKRLALVLKPGGRAFFYESSGRLGLLWWCRRRVLSRFGVPRSGDATEKSLHPTEIDVLRRHSEVQFEYPETTLGANSAAIYLLRGGPGRPAWALG